MGDLMRRARCHGARSIYSGDEPRSREFDQHWPKPKSKTKRRRFPPLPKRIAKQKRKDRAQNRAEVKSYQVRLASPCRIYLKEETKNCEGLSKH